MGRPLRVLIVEDSPDDGELVARELRRAGFDPSWKRVEEAGALREALAQEPWDLVLSDYSMPRFSAPAALAVLQEQGIDLPFIIISGTVGEEAAVAAMKAGAHDYLTKGQLARLGAAVDRELRETVVRRERLRAQEDLREANRRLEQALADLRKAHAQMVKQERLRALGEMASGIAHDFNNALAAILGFTELLLARPQILQDPKLAAEYLDHVRTAARDAGSVVRRLREFYRPREKGEIFGPVDLPSLVRRAVSLTQPKWKDQAQAQGRTITVETRLEAVPPIAGSEPELREVLINLIFNAVDAMPRGGTLTLATRAEGSHAVLEVTDTGTGMTEEVHRRCLEPFFTTKGQAGTGLGLSMAYGVVRRHEGSVQIETEAERGTTFRFRFPALTTAAAAAPAERNGCPIRRRRILVVDDEAPLREILREYLALDGHVVTVAADAREGLERFYAERFDLVITDQAMPGMSGAQLAAAVKRESPEKPVILLTGFGDLMAGAGEKPAGVDLVLSKPVTVDALREALARVAAADA